MTTPDPTPPPTEPREMTDEQLAQKLEPTARDHGYAGTLRSPVELAEAARRLRARSELAQHGSTDDWAKQAAAHIGKLCRNSARPEQNFYDEGSQCHKDAADLILAYAAPQLERLAIAEQDRDFNERQLIAANEMIRQKNERLARLESVAKFMDTHWHDYNQFIRSDSDGFTYRTSKDSWMEANTFVAVVEGAMKYAASTNNGKL